MVDVAHLQRQARISPRGVRRACEQALVDQSLPIESRAGLLLALGWAAFTQADTVAAADAVAAAQNLGPAAVDATELLRLESAVLIEQGRTEMAEARVRHALRQQSEGNRSGVWSALGAAQSVAGDHDGALVSFGNGLRESREFHDRLNELLLLSNRAVVFLELGRFTDADRDLSQVRQACRNEDFPRLYATSTHNLGVVEARRGRLGTAIGYFNEASGLLAEFGDLISQSHALVDQALLFLDAGLLDEALNAARRSLGLFEQLGAQRKVADALVVQARTMAARGNWQAASELATAALSRVAADSKAAARANQLIYSCELVGGMASAAPDTERLRHLAEVEADLVVDAALVLAEQGRIDEAIGLLRPVTMQPEDDSTLTGLHNAVASAVLSKLELRHVDARRDVAQGLELAHSSAMALGVSDLRAMTERRVRQLRDCGVELEYGHGSASGIVAVLERARAVVLLPEPNLNDDELSLLTQIRSLAKSIFERSVSGDELVVLTQRRNRLERDLRNTRRARAVQADVETAVGEAATLSITTVHLFVHGGDLHAVVGRDQRWSEPISLGDFAAVRHTCAALRMTLAARAGSGHAPGHHRLAESLAAQLKPLLDELHGETSVAVIPEAAIGQIPWPLVLDAAVCVGPSQRLLNVADSQAGGSVVAVIGPGLEYAEAEASAVAAVYSNTVVLGAGEATSAEMINHFSTAGVLHFAGHGTFRADNPLYSSLRLEDGPLTMFDLLGQGTPEVVVFSSCDVGRLATISSLGLASLLLTRGCRSIVASTGPVNDAAAAGLMATMHRHHESGRSMASSLRIAQSEWIATDPSVALFASYGVG